MLTTLSKHEHSKCKLRLDLRGTSVSQAKQGEDLSGVDRVEDRGTVHKYVTIYEFLVITRLTYTPKLPPSFG